MIHNLENQLEAYIIKDKELFYRLAYSYVRNKDDALDIVQESVYKAFSSIHSLRNANALKTWFYRIIVNTALDFLRKQKREVVMPEEFLIDQDAGMRDDYSDIDLEEALEDLHEKYRTIIVLRFFEDLQLDEIAMILDENINTIKSRLYRALEVLRISMDARSKEARNG